MRGGTIQRTHCVRACLLAALVLALPLLVVAQTAPAKTSAPPAANGRSIVERPWTGDFDGMVKRRLVRILTPYSKTHYFIDRGVQRGLAYEAGTKLESRDNCPGHGERRAMAGAC